MEHAIFGPHQGQLVAQLIDWVAMVTNPPAVEGAAKIAADDPATAEQVKQANYEEPAAIAPSSPAGPRIGAQLQPGWRPKDAFDPEIFNRQFTRQTEAAPGGGNLSPR
jgi:hypothetical protein